MAVQRQIARLLAVLIFRGLKWPAGWNLDGAGLRARHPSPVSAGPRYLELTMPDRPRTSPKPARVPELEALAAAEVLELVSWDAMVVL